MPRWPTFKAPHVCTHYGWKNNIRWYSMGPKSSFKYTSKSSLCFWIFGLDWVWLEMMIALKRCPRPRFPCDHVDVAGVWTHMFVCTMDERRWMIFEGSQPKTKTTLFIVTLLQIITCMLRWACLFRFVFIFIGHMCVKWCGFKSAHQKTYVWKRVDMCSKDVVWSDLMICTW
jgi:hypothetical protein